MTVTQSVFEPQPIKLAAIQNNDAKKAAEVPKNKEASDQPDFN